MRVEMFDIVTVGHVVIDVISSSSFKELKTAIGGPPTYASVAASNLGSKVSLVSNVGEDFPDSYLLWLKGWGVDLSHFRRIKGAKTTRFSIRYHNGERELRLIDLAPPINVTNEILNLNYKAVHVAPVAGEVSCEAVRKLSRADSIVSLDSQGFIRSFDVHGRLSLVRLGDMDMLKYVDVLKASEEEILALTGVSDVSQAIDIVREFGVKVVAVTFGGRGSVIDFDGERHFIPAFRVEETIDPTGAGDAFIGAFLSEYVRELDPLWSVCVGSATASFIVEGLGTSKLKGRDEVYRRAELIYDKVS